MLFFFGLLIISFLAGTAFTKVSLNRLYFYIAIGVIILTIFYYTNPSFI